MCGTRRRSPFIGNILCGQAVRLGVCSVFYHLVMLSRSREEYTSFSRSREEYMYTIFSRSFFSRSREEYTIFSRNFLRYNFGVWRRRPSPRCAEWQGIGDRDCLCWTFAVRFASQMHHSSFFGACRTPTHSSGLFFWLS